MERGPTTGSSRRFSESWRTKWSGLIALPVDGRDSGAQLRRLSFPLPSSTAGMRKFRSFADGLANWCDRPFAGLPISPGTGGERQKAAVGATGRTRHDRSFPRASSECVGSTRRGHFSFTLASNSLKADPACLRSLNEARRGRGPISRVCLATHTRELRCLRKWRIEQRYLADFRFDFGQTII